MLSFLEYQGWIVQRSRNAFQAFFKRRESCWVTAHLKNGEIIIGWFGPDSFASTLPTSGHLYLELVLVKNENGELDFKKSIEANKGILLRPEDYHILEVEKSGANSPNA